MPPTVSNHYHGFVPTGAEPRTQAAQPIDAPVAASAAGQAPTGAGAGAAGTMPQPVLPQTPGLPDANGPQAKLHEVQAATSAAFSDDGDVSGFTAWDLIYRAACRSQQMQGRLKRGANAGMFAAKLREVQLSQEQISGQNRSTVLQLGGNLGVSGLASVASIAASFISQDVAQLVSNGIQQVGKPAIDLADRLSHLGGTYRANAASVGLKRTAIEVQASTQQADTGRAAQDQAQEELRAAAQFIAGYIQRKSEVSDRQASK